MQRSKWLHFVFVLLVVLCAFAGMNPAGCGGDDDDSSSSAPADDDAATADDDATDDDLDDDVSDDDSADDDATDDDTADDDTADDDTGGCVDMDGDGYGENCPAGDDCWDFDATKWEMIHPYRDADYDTYPGTRTFMCAGMPLPNGWSMTPTDCDDADPAVNPGMFDFPDDGIDNDCANGDVATSTLNVIYVDGAGGDDANPGTALLPMKTINAGVAAATLGGADGVVVATGTYHEDVVTTVSIFGGYEAGTWTRDLSGTAPVTRVEPVAADTTILVDGAVGPMAVNGFEVQVPEGTSLARGVAVEASGIVWIGANKVLDGQADRVVGILSAEFETNVIGNDIRMAEGYESFGIDMRSESAVEPTNIASIVKNEIHGNVENSTYVVGISMAVNSMVIENNIDIDATSYRTNGILGGFNDYLLSFLSESKVVNNDVYISGESDYLTGVSIYHFSYALFTAPVIGNRINIEAGDHGGTGIFSAKSASNQILMSCGNASKGTISGMCVGISTWGWEGAGIHRQNSIILSANSSTLETYGIYIWEFLLGQLYGSVVDNTIYISGTPESAAGVNLSSFSTFCKKCFGYINAEVINNNIVVPASCDFVSANADIIDLNVSANNRYCGPVRFTDASREGLANSMDEDRNVSVDPLFVDAENGDLRLRPDSPLIDAGVYNPIPMSFFPLVAPIWNEEWNRSPVDLDGTRRPKGAAMDIGADEYTP